MSYRYRDILAQCLAHEDKAHRDRVLARYPDHVAQMVRAVMKGLAKHRTAWVRHAGAGRRVKEGPWEYRPMNKEERRALRNVRKATIEPEWLRRRVETMVRERYQHVTYHRHQMRLALEELR